MLRPPSQRSPLPVGHPQPQGPPPKKPNARLEATGVLIIAVLVLMITLVRYWHHIAWSAR